MNKVYVVTKYGGEYEDSWEHIVGVCSTPEVADYLKAKVEESYSTSITESKWDEMWDAVNDTTIEDLDSYEIMHKLFPEYSYEEILDAKNTYDDYWGYRGVYIQEVDFYDKQSDIDAINFNSK